MFCAGKGQALAYLTLPSACPMHAGHAGACWGDIHGGRHMGEDLFMPYYRC